MLEFLAAAKEACFIMGSFSINNELNHNLHPGFKVLKKILTRKEKSYKQTEAIAITQLRTSLSNEQSPESSESVECTVVGIFKTRHV